MTREERDFAKSRIEYLLKISSFVFDEHDKEALEAAIQALSQEPCDDAIDREYLFKVLDDFCGHDRTATITLDTLADLVYDMPSVTQKSGKWIPVSERLPEDLEPVNITWVNHEPEPYYHDIKDRNFVATGIYYRGQWYWYSTTCADYLGEYGSNEIDKVDDAVEIIAWMPLPKSYEPQEPETWNGMHGQITAPKGTFKKIYEDAESEE